MAKNLKPEPIADAIARADRTLRFTAQRGRENGPYDLDGFAISRRGETISPIGLRVEGKTMIASFADPIEIEDEVL